METIATNWNQTSWYNFKFLNQNPFTEILSQSKKKKKVICYKWNPQLKVIKILEGIPLSGFYKLYPTLLYSENMRSSDILEALSQILLIKLTLKIAFGHVDPSK